MEKRILWEIGLILDTGRRFFSFHFSSSVKEFDLSFRKWHFKQIIAKVYVVGYQM